MDTKNTQKDDWDSYDNPDPADEVRRKAFLAAYLPKRAVLLNKVRAGEMTEDECADALIQLRKDLGGKTLYTPEEERSAVLNDMMHSLHRKELDRIQRETGRIID